MRIAPAAPPVEVTEYLEAVKAADQANLRLVAAKNKLLDTMAERHAKNVKWIDSDQRVNSITYVVRRTPVIDEKGLRKALGARVFDKYTVKKLDKKKMEAAMETGEIDPVTVAKFVTEQTSAPYLKFSLSDQKEEQ